MIYQKIEFLICNSVQCALYTFNPLRFVFLHLYSYKIIARVIFGTENEAIIESVIKRERRGGGQSVGS